MRACALGGAWRGWMDPTPPDLHDIVQRSKDAFFPFLEPKKKKKNHFRLSIAFFSQLSELNILSVVGTISATFSSCRQDLNLFDTINRVRTRVAPPKPLPRCCYFRLNALHAAFTPTASARAAPALHPSSPTTHSTMPSMTLSSMMPCIFAFLSTSLYLPLPKLTME